MDLIEAKIAEIKNLNLIYIFTTDNILKNSSDKYVGVKVLYDKDKTFSLDYKSEYFETFMKRILSRYNKEKNKRNIILLGDLTKKLVQDSSFALIEENKDFVQPSGVLVNAKKNQVKGYEKYLNRVIKMILKAIKNYDCVNIDSLDGFNYKYVVNYSVGNIKKQLYMLLFVREDGNLDFRISNIEGKNVNISGSLEDHFNSVIVNFYEDTQKLKGSILYDAKEKSVIESLYKDNKPLIIRETEDTILDEDESLISFYMNLCGLELPKNIMKIDDYCYLLTDGEVLNKEEDGVFYNNFSCQINISKEDVIIKHRKKSGISKYDDQIKAVLEEVISEFTLKKLNIDNNFSILIEKKSNVNGITSYSYKVLKLDEDKDLFNSFDISSEHEIKEEVKNLNSAKQYIKGIKGGKK